MDKEARLEQITPSSPSAPRFRPYSSILMMSRKLGHAATNSLSDARDILTKDHPMPSTEQLFGTATPLADITRREKTPPTPEALQQIVTKSHETLARATTVFPFKLFPDTVLVDRTKVTIIKRNFFWSEDVVSIRIEDVLNCNASVDLFFGSLNVSSRVMNSTDHYQIKFLWKQDAMHLKHLIQGYVIAQHNNIDVAHLSHDDLIRTLCELGDDSRA